MKIPFLSLVTALIFLSSASYSLENTQDIKNKPATPQSFSEINIGALGIYDFFNDVGGFELRSSVNSNRVYLPLELMYVSRNFRVRTWPEIFFSDRRTPKDASIFGTLFTEAEVKHMASDYSYAELGAGAGFSGSGLNLAVWLTTNFYQGSPSVMDLFGFRARVELRPIANLYAMFGLRIGTAIFQSTAGYTSSGTTLNFELEVGYTFWKGLGFLIGMEARTDNLAGLLDSRGNVPGISNKFQLLMKFGFTYKF